MRKWVVGGTVAACATALAVFATTAGGDDDVTPEYLVEFVDDIDRLCAERYAETDPLVIDAREADGDLAAVGPLHTEIAAGTRAWLEQARALDVPPEGEDEVADLLDAYDRLAGAREAAATAATDGDQTSYDAARTDLDAADADVSARFLAMGTSVCGQGSPGDRPEAE